MARQSQQGQALRVLASSQPCSLSLSMLHLQVAKAKRRLPPAGLRVKGWRLFLFYSSRDPVLKIQPNLLLHLKANNRIDNKIS
jgi:hypothetical protein